VSALTFSSTLKTPLRLIHSFPRVLGHPSNITYTGGATSFGSFNLSTLAIFLRMFSLGDVWEGEGSQWSIDALTYLLRFRLVSFRGEEQAAAAA
jgi:hypothetical protein